MSHRALTLLTALAALMVAPAAQAKADRALEAAIAGPLRSAENTARDGARHPLETLSFWGVKPRQTIIEISPGSGYWTEILAPYAMATKGAYIASAADLDNPKLSEAARKGRVQAGWIFRGQRQSQGHKRPPLRRLDPAAIPLDGGWWTFG